MVTRTELPVWAVRIIYGRLLFFSYELALVSRHPVFDPTFSLTSFLCFLSCYIYAFYLVTAFFRQNARYILAIISVLTIIWLIPYGRSYAKLDIEAELSFPRNDSKEMFAFIRNETEANSRILFVKPRILALYTNRSTMVPHCPTNLNSFNSFLKNFNITYLVQPKIDKSLKEENRCLENWLLGRPTNVVLVFENKGFKVFRKVQ